MKRLVATGEERVGKLVQQLMSNEKFVAGVQAIVSRALVAKGAADKGLKVALSAMNLPSKTDLEQLQVRLDSLEAMLSDFETRLGRSTVEAPERRS